MKLTVIDKNLTEMEAKTPSGMAFWAGTGPAQTTCRECVSYEFNGYKRNRGNNRGGTLKPGVCNKYLSMMGSAGSKVPFDTPSCKYFELNKQIPSIIESRKS